MCLCIWLLQRHFKPVTRLYTVKYTYSTLNILHLFCLISNSLFYYLISFSLFGSVQSYTYVIYVKLVGLLRWRVDRCLSIKSLRFFSLLRLWEETRARAIERAENKRNSYRLREILFLGWYGLFFFLQAVKHNLFL